MQAMKLTGVFLMMAVMVTAQPSPVVVGADGADAAAIRGAVTTFQNTLGPLGGANGRREITWDSVPVAFSAPNALPGDFFRPQGVVLGFDTPGVGTLQVSASGFDNLLASYAGLFPVYSAEKLFTSVGTNDYNVDFHVPGTQTRAKVRGFGAVFANVALPFTTAIEFYNSDGLLLGRFFAPVGARGGRLWGRRFPTDGGARPDCARKCDSGHRGRSGERAECGGCG